MPFVIYSIIVKLKYFTCWINNKLILDLLERIKKDWQSLKSEEELEVLRKYTEEGRLFTKFYSSTLSDLRLEQVL
ncbi:hypothetical protein KM043_007899 [Ampulex compressa]|nr:hypothetical protein KM043_007899 [Ampulex compressa]